MAVLFAEIKALGYTDSLTLLYTYLNQGRAGGDRVVPSPRRLTSPIMTRPEDLPDKHRAHLGELLVACPALAALAHLVGEFAKLMAKHRGRGWSGCYRMVGYVVGVGCRIGG